MKDERDFSTSLIPTKLTVGDPLWHRLAYGDAVWLGMPTPPRHLVATSEFQEPPTEGVWGVVKSRLEPPTLIELPKGAWPVDLPPILSAIMSTTENARDNARDNLLAFWMGDTPIFPRPEVYEPIDSSMEQLRLRSS